MIVIDASIALRHMTSAEPESLMDLVQTQELVAPDLIIAEVTNALATMQRHQKIAGGDALLVINQLPLLIDRLFPMAPLAARSFEIAGNLQHPAYDCFYLALAESLNVTFVTADLKLLNRLYGSQFEPLARSL